MGFDLLPYKDGYFQKLVDLLSLSFEMKAQDKQELIRWKLLNRIWGEPIIYTAFSEDRLIGVYTSIPHPISYENETILATGCIDMVTHPDYRRQGIIKKLAEKTYQEVKNQNYELSFGFSNEEGVKVDLNANGYGYFVLGKFQKYYKLVVRKKSCSLSLKETGDINVPAFINPYLQIKKDKKYLDWRYITKPGVDCQLFEIQGDTTGLVVLKFEHNSCYVYDIVSDYSDQKNIFEIVRAIENYCFDKHIHMVVYNCLKNKFWEKIFASFKFLKLPDVGKKYYFTVKVHNDQNKNLYLNKNNWLLLSGDII